METSTRGLLKRFAGNESGAALIFYTTMAAVTFGLVGLAVDNSRYYTLTTELQNLADAAALAGAKELDGTVGARDRARDRAVGLLSNSPKFADLAPGVDIVRANITFYTNLNDTSEAASDATARFIRVPTSTRSVTASFVRALGITRDLGWTASATAGSHYVACNVQPLMICNPYEAQGRTLSNALAPAGDRGRMFRLKPKGGQNAYFPGDFGWLDPPNVQNGANALSLNLASSSPNFCYISNVTVSTGQVASSVADGINPRFDVPVNGNSALAQTINAMPVPNVVIKGYRQNNCNFNLNANPNEEPLPRDDCMPVRGSNTTSNTCGAGGTDSNVGSGVFTTGRTRYFNNQHFQDRALATNYQTRFDIYLAESGCNATTGVCPTTVPNSPLRFGNSNQDENPAPRCMANRTGGLDRRLIYVAIVNCSQYAVRGNSPLGIVPQQYGQFFLTEPASGNEIYAEFVKVVNVGDDDSKVHHVVQLYRRSVAPEDLY
ncbi:pilus assembly protein TadG-related protein [Alsobacter sp. R-9]